MVRRARVLMVDDHPAVAKAISRLLSLDCEVVGIIIDGSAALEAVQRLEPDVVVLDMNLPNINGLEACRQIARAHPGTKVIVFTAMTDPGMRERALAAGASAFVSKLATEELLAAIESCMQLIEQGAKQP
jgi:DNA-binding NarL/FixJ family response regulator